MYPSPAFLRRVSEDATGRGTLPFFASAVVGDETLAHLLARFHRAVADSSPRLATESLLLSALTHLIIRHADDPHAPRRVGRERRATGRARAYLEANFARNVSLSELSALVGLSRYHLARAFTREAGMPPHLYLEAVRIRRARELLERPVSIAETALAVGYADQAHLTRRFKRQLGITPGQYARARNRAGALR